MSVIAWDGVHLAADRRASRGTLICTTEKIFRVRDCLVGYSGEADHGEEVMAWFARGAVPDEFNASMRDKDTFGGLLVIWPNRDIWMYERTPYPIKHPPQQFAIGSGRDFALAAMHLGKTAREAVLVACEFDSACGNGVTVMRHE